MFSKKIQQDMIDHALSEKPKEACGIVVGKKYVPLENIHSDTLNHFELPTKPYMKALRDGTLKAIIHSHTEGHGEPSIDDQKAQLSGNVPWGLVCLRMGAFHRIVWWGPGVKKVDLVGRDFITGVQDCYSLVQDYYEKKKVKLQPVARDRDWMKRGENLFMDNLEETGFEIVSLAEVQEGDVLLMNIGSKVPDHCGVYLGGGLILHHLMDKPSGRQPLQMWRKYITHCLRAPK